MDNTFSDISTFLPLQHHYFKAANFVIKIHSTEFSTSYLVRVKSDCALRIGIDENG